MLTCPLCSQDLHFAVSYSPATVSLVQFYSRVPITPYEEVMNAPIVTDQPVEEERKHQSLMLSCLSFAKTNLRSTTNNV